MTRPPFSYRGGKTTLADRIVNLLPKHDHYVEPFGGSLAVLLAKRPSKMETVNDLDGDLVTFWRVLRDRPDDLIRACALTPHSRTEYVNCRDTTSPVDELEVARRVWSVLAQGRGGTLRDSKNGWRHFVIPRGSSVGMPAYLAGYVERMAAATERLHHISLECMPALDLIAKYGRDPDTLIFADPPYPGEVRGDADYYRHELKTGGEHRELGQALRVCRATVILAGYACPLYDQELFADWHRLEMPTTTGNGRDGARDRVEVLWSNVPLGTQLDLFDLAGGAA